MRQDFSSARRRGSRGKTKAIFGHPALILKRPSQGLAKRHASRGSSPRLDLSSSFGTSGECLTRSANLEHFQAKWPPVRLKMRQNKDPERFSDSTEKALEATNDFLQLRSEALG
jgi:hypothetical protein